MTPERQEEAFRIVEEFAKRSDPVYEVSRIRLGWVEGQPGRKNDFIRRCKICGAESGHNEENVRHNTGCVWIAALKWVRQ